MPETHPKPYVVLTTDSALTEAAIARLLEQTFSVSSVSDAESTWKMVVENPQVSVLICQLSLAVDQFGLLERLQSANERRVAAIPVLLLVGESDGDESLNTAFRVGATDFINMPFVSSELLTRVRLQAQLFAQHNIRQTLNIQQPATSGLRQLVPEGVFNSQLQHEISFSERHKTYFSVCKLGLDSFSAIAAGLDKKAAVAVVRAVAEILLQEVRCEDTLCSLGEARFFILYPATNGIGAAVAINRIVRKVSSCKTKITGKQVPVSISVAIFTDIANQYSDVDVVLNILQSRLDEALAQGGNRVISAGRTDEKPLPSVDRALQLIAEQRSEVIAPQTEALINSILPLLEYADGVLELGMSSVNQHLRERLK
ncbi:MAG: diguanylate cyclase [Gammaproteobacteria bacterium]|nr:diguanylate cyclase [Gammaproteobacteria bacterium]